jgi:microcystin-dependent protein
MSNDGYNKNDWLDGCTVGDATRPTPEAPEPTGRTNYRSDQKYPGEHLHTYADVWPGPYANGTTDTDENGNLIYWYEDNWYYVTIINPDPGNPNAPDGGIAGLVPWDGPDNAHHDITLGIEHSLHGKGRGGSLCNLAGYFIVNNIDTVVLGCPDSPMIVQASTRPEVILKDRPDTVEEMAFLSDIKALQDQIDELNNDIEDLDGRVDYLEECCKQVKPKLDELEGELEDHIHDYNNPHHVTASQLGIDMSQVPIGSGMLWFDDDAPPNFIFAEGQELDVTEYPLLFALFGYRYGGSGQTFKVPDMRGVSPIGYWDGVTPYNTLGAKIGSATTVLTVDNLPSHKHTILPKTSFVTNSKTGLTSIGQKVTSESSGEHKHTALTGETNSTNIVNGASLGSENSSPEASGKLGGSLSLTGRFNDMVVSRGNADPTSTGGVSAYGNICERGTSDTDTMAIHIVQEGAQGSGTVLAAYIKSTYVEKNESVSNTGSDPGNFYIYRAKNWAETGKSPLANEVRLNAIHGHKITVTASSADGAHTHSITMPALAINDHSHTIPDHTHESELVGSGTPINNIHPSIVCHYIIKAKSTVTVQPYTIDENFNVIPEGATEHGGTFVYGVNGMSSARGAAKGEIILHKVIDYVEGYWVKFLKIPLLPIGRSWELEWTVNINHHQATGVTKALGPFAVSFQYNQVELLSFLYNTLPQMLGEAELVLGKYGSSENLVKPVGSTLEGIDVTYKIMSVDNYIYLYVNNGGTFERIGTLSPHYSAENANNLKILASAYYGDKTNAPGVQVKHLRLQVY